MKKPNKPDLSEFIGILNDKEAEEMRKETKKFRISFNKSAKTREKKYCAKLIA